ncbi:MAG: peptide deformylase [Spirochaetota bacterium]
MIEKRIRVYPDPVLRAAAQQVEQIGPYIDTLIKQMFDIMKEEGGVGLAAVQIGVLKRVVVVSLEEKGFERLALVNPEIQSFSASTIEMEEGCLSLPGVNAVVERPSQVVVKARSRSGRLMEITASGLLARVLQHEIDHLNGVLFIQRLHQDEKQKIAEKTRALERQYASVRSTKS